MTQKSANIYARIEPDIKKQAEDILSSLGVSASSAINMFYKQIILKKGIPFDITLNTAKPADISLLSEEELSAELEKGFNQIAEGKVRSAKEAFADLYKKYDL
jgi:addiction module RelB/DinJ family antitoxin